MLIADPELSCTAKGRSETQDGSDAMKRENIR